MATTEFASEAPAPSGPSAYDDAGRSFRAAANGLLALVCVCGTFVTYPGGAGSAMPSDSIMPTDLRVLRREIIRREETLLRDYEEAAQLMGVLADTPTLYRKQVGDYLATCQSAVRQVLYEDHRLKRLGELRRQHALLRQEAQRAGVLLSGPVTRLVETHKSSKRVIFGMPYEALLFDKAKIAKALDIRARQYKILDEWKETAAAYEEAYRADLEGINKLLRHMYAQAQSTQNECLSQRSRLKGIFRTASVEHVLGTPKDSTRAQWRRPTSRIAADELPGMTAALALAPVKAFELPSRVEAPKPPAEFQVYRDGFKYTKAEQETLEDQAASDERLLLLERYHVELKIADTVVGLFRGVVKPFKDEFTRDDQSFGMALANSLVGLGKTLTVDTVVGAYDSATRLLDKAKEACKTEELSQHSETLVPLLGDARDLLDRVGARYEHGMKKPSATDFPDTAKGRLEYLQALQEYHQHVNDWSAELQKLNERFDDRLQTATDALNVYLAGRGLKARFKGIVERCKQNRQGLVRVKTQVKTLMEGRAQAKRILADPEGAPPEQVKVAKEFVKTNEKLNAKAEALVKQNVALKDLFDKLDDETPVPSEKIAKIKKSIAENRGDYSSPAPPQGGKIVRTQDGSRVTLKKKVGSGAFGDVYEVPGEGVMKVYKRLPDSPKQELRNPIQNRTREMEGNNLAKGAGIRVAEVKKVGMLANGSPYVIKEQIPKGNIMSNYIEDHAYKLPATHQKALLKLTDHLVDDHLLAGDMNPGNVFFETLPDGSVRAGLLEGDFIKRVPKEMSTTDLCQLQFQTLTNSSPISNMVLQQHFPAFSTGAFKGMIDQGLIDQYVKNRQISLDMSKLLKVSGNLAKLMKKGEAKPIPRPRPSGSTPNVSKEPGLEELLKGLEEQIQVRVQAGDGAPANVNWEDLLDEHGEIVIRDGKVVGPPEAPR